MTLPETAGAETTEGHAEGTAPSSGGATPAGDSFAAAYAAAYPDVEQQLFDANAFDAVMVAFLAALQAGSSDTIAISENMISTSVRPGTQGTFEDLDVLVAAILAGEDIDYQGAGGPIDYTTTETSAPLEPSTRSVAVHRRRARRSLETVGAGGLGDARRWHGEQRAGPRPRPFTSASGSASGAAAPAASSAS